MQGYLFCRPLPIAELIGLLKTRSKAQANPHWVDVNGKLVKNGVP